MAETWSLKERRPRGSTSKPPTHYLFVDLTSCDFRQGVLVLMSSRCVIIPVFFFFLFFQTFRFFYLHLLFLHLHDGCFMMLHDASKCFGKLQGVSWCFTMPLKSSSNKLTYKVQLAVCRSMESHQREGRALQEGHTQALQRDTRIRKNKTELTDCTGKQENNIHRLSSDFFPAVMYKLELFIPTSVII